MKEIEEHLKFLNFDYAGFLEAQIEQEYKDQETKFLNSISRDQDFKEDLYEIKF